MNILTWLKEKLAGNDSAEFQFEEGEQHFDGLDLKSVLDAHTAWNKRLTL